MNEQRIFILKMVAEGKITPEEAAVLLDSSGEDNADSDRPDDAHSKTTDWASSVVESLQSAFRAAPDITENILENLKEVGEEVRHAFHDVRKELENKKLIDFSGLTEFMNRIREVRLGQTHEFEDRVTGDLLDADGTPKLELLTRNGDVVISGWDQPTYEIVVRKKVYNRDEETARRMADAAVDRVILPREVRIDGGFMRGVVVSYDVRLPKKRAVNLKAQTHQGQIVVEDVTLEQARLSTSNGSVRVRQIESVYLDISTVNGKVWAQGVDASEGDLSTVNGSIDWKGRALKVDLSTVNGPIRYTPETVPSLSDHDELESTLMDSAHIKTVNGGVTLRLPALNDDLGIYLEAQVSSVDLNTEETGLIMEASDDGEDSRHGPVIAKSKGYENAVNRIELTVDCVNGRVQALPILGS